MKLSGVAKPIWLAVLVCGGVVAANQVAAQAASEFACQVVTEAGKAGLVVVQANSREVAEQVAVGARAYTTDQALSPATTVVQCIVMREERFKDQGFQAFYMTVPR